MFGEPAKVVDDSLLQNGTMPAASEDERTCLGEEHVIWTQHRLRRRPHRVSGQRVSTPTIRSVAGEGGRRQNRCARVTPARRDAAAQAVPSMINNVVSATRPAVDDEHHSEDRPQQRIPFVRTARQPLRGDGNDHDDRRADAVKHRLHPPTSRRSDIESAEAKHHQERRKNQCQPDQRRARSLHPGSSRSPSPFARRVARA